MQSPDTAEHATPRRSALKLWLILALSLAPIVASYVAYYFWRPASHVNYGELIDPRPLPQTQLATHDGRAFTFAELKGEWVLLMAAPAACDERCRTNLTYLRQVRLAQGKESERIERLWLLADAGIPDAVLLAEHPGLIVARAKGAAIVESLPAASSALDHIYVVDPLGNLMMRYPADPDPRRMLKDLSRLLRHSKWK